MRRHTQAMARVLACAAIMLAAERSFGQATTVIRAQVWDGSAWSNSVRVQPSVGGGLVFVRYTATYSGTATPYAMAGANFQPMVSPALAGDTLLIGYGSPRTPITPIEPPDPRVPYGYDEGTYGRPDYLGTSNIVASSAIMAHQNAIDGVNVLRLAQATVTNAPGSGAALNNANGSGGVPLVQNVSGPGSPPDAPPVREGFVGIPIYGVRLDLTDMDADRNLADPTRDVVISGTSFSAGGTFRWYANNGELTGSIASPAALIEFVPAYVDIVPEPGALIAVVALLAHPRRRWGARSFARSA